MEKSYQSKPNSMKIARKKILVVNGINQKSKQMKKSLNDLLVETYVNVRNSDTKRVDSFPKNYNLLQELLKRHSLNYLIINRYCYKQTYTLTIHSNTKPFKHSVDLPYDEGELLTYINNEEFPPLLLSILSELNVNVFYNGCVITEIRLYQGPPNSDNYNSTFVLLKPNTLSFISDIRSITSKGKWSWEEKQRLESILLLATSEPLCLDPDPTVAIIENHVQHQKKRFSQYPLQRLALKHSRVNKRKRKKSSKYASPSFLNCLDYFSYNLKADFQRNFPKKDRRTFKLLPIYDDFSPSIAPALKLRVDISIPEPKFAFTCDPVIVEEYIYEFERGYKELYYSMLTICLRPHDEQYFGLLYVWLDKDSEGQHSWFRIGERKMLDIYINQLTEILCEEGSRYIHCTRSTPTTSPKTIFSVGEKYSSGESDSEEFFRNPSSGDIALALHTEILALFNKKECECCDREVKIALKRAALVLRNSGFSTAILRKRILELEQREITGQPPYPLVSTVGKVAAAPLVPVDSDFVLPDVEHPEQPVLSESGIICLPQHIANDIECEETLFSYLNRKRDERHMVCMKCTDAENVYLMEWCPSQNCYICSNEDCSVTVKKFDERIESSEEKLGNHMEVEAEDLHLPTVEETSDEIKKVTQTKYIMFEDNNLCWLNSTLHLLLHNKDLQLFGSDDCFLSNIINGYHNVIKLFNEGDETINKKEGASKELLSLQEKITKYLTPLMKVKPGERNSSLSAIVSMIGSNECVQKLFEVRYMWRFDCMECVNSSKEKDFKKCITLDVVDSFNPKNPATLITCSKCKLSHQEKKMVYLKTSNTLLFHFPCGIRKDPLVLDFDLDGKRFVMTGLVILQNDCKGSNHLITYIRNPETNYWLNCDDRKKYPERFSKQPEFNLREMHLIMYEARLLSSCNPEHSVENKHEGSTEGENEMELSQSTDAIVFNRSTDKMSKKDEVKKVTPTNYLMFQNRDNLCWLNSSLHLLLHNKTLKSFNREHSLISKIINSYYDVLKSFNMEGENIDEKEEAFEKLITMQREMINYLKPILKFKEGECESAFFATMNIIRNDDSIQKLFEVKYYWKFDCKLCECSGKELSTKRNTITLNKVSIFNPTNPITLISCPNPNCKAPDQERKLIYKNMSKNLIFHFECGIKEGSLVLDFELNDKKFLLTGVVVLTKVCEIASNTQINHFITYIRDPENNSWLNCDDRYKCRTFSEQPKFNLEEIFMVMYEGSSPIPKCTGHSPKINHKDLNKGEYKMDLNRLSTDTAVLDEISDKILKKDELKKATKIKYYLFKNNGNLCWLNSSLHLLLHNKALRLYNGEHCMLSKIVKSYHDIIKTFNEGNETANEKEEACEKLLSLQEEMVNYLEPIIRLKPGQHDSAFCATMNIIRHNDAMQKLFEVKYIWKLHCKACRSTKKERSSAGKNIITLNKAQIFNPVHPVSLISCPSCKTPDQEKKLIYKSTSKNLIFHFEHGIKKGSLILDFELNDKKFVLTGVIILTKIYLTSNVHVNHFITYIRDPDSNCWLNCDDRYKYQTFSKQPKLNFEEIFMVMYEGTLLNSKSIENSSVGNHKDLSDKNSGVNLGGPSSQAPAIDFQSDDDGGGPLSQAPVIDLQSDDDEGGPLSQAPVIDLQSDDDDLMIIDK